MLNFERTFTTEDTEVLTEVTEENFRLDFAPEMIITNCVLCEYLPVLCGKKQLTSVN